MNSLDLSKYRRVYQTWNLVKNNTFHKGESNAVVTDPIQSIISLTEMRHLVQMARVERCLSIHDLATMVCTSPEVIAAFERGDDVPNEEVQKSIKRVLCIDSNGKIVSKKQKNL